MRQAKRQGKACKGGQGQGRGRWGQARAGGGRQRASNTGRSDHERVHAQEAGQAPLRAGGPSIDMQEP